MQFIVPTSAVIKPYIGIGCPIVIKLIGIDPHKMHPIVVACDKVGFILSGGVSWTTVAVAKFKQHPIQYTNTVKRMKLSCPRIYKNCSTIMHIKAVKAAARYAINSSYF